jgi:hypothetical protein
VVVEDDIDLPGLGHQFPGAGGQFLLWFPSSCLGTPLAQSSAWSKWCRRASPAR